MKKLFAVFCLSILIIFSLSACGSNKNNTTKNETPSKVAKISNRTIRVGADLELTGPVATYGKSVLNSFRMAFEEANAKGGVLGKKLELIEADNKSEPSESGNSITKLITKDKVNIVIGPVTSSNALAAAPIAQNNKVILLTPTATNIDVTKKGDYIFRACFIDDFQGTVAAKFVQNTLKKKAPAILIDSSSDYSVGLAKAFRRDFKGTIVDEESYLATDKDFRSQLTKIKAKKPDVLYVPAYYQTAGLIIKQARELGITIPIVGSDGWDSPELLKVAGSSALNNAYYTNHYSVDSKDPKVVKFVKAFEKKYKYKPDALAALGYDGAKLLIDAINRAKSDKTTVIRDALAATKDFNGVTGKITIGKDRNPIKSAVILQFKNGKQSFLETVNP